MHFELEWHCHSLLHFLVALPGGIVCPRQHCLQPARPHSKGRALTGQCLQLALQLFAGDRSAASANKFGCFNYTEFIGSRAFILKLNCVS